MKSKARKPSRVVAKKRSIAKTLASTRNSKSSPYGFRAVENAWLRAHPEELRKCIGEYVIVEGTEIVAHGPVPAELFKISKARGIKIPYIFFVEPPLPPDTFRVGL